MACRGGGLCGTWLRICHVIGHMMTNDVIILWGVGALGPLSGRWSDRMDGFRAEDADAVLVVIGTDSWGVR